jgi:hypothetical protein
MFFYNKAPNSISYFILLYLAGTIDLLIIIFKFYEYK